MKLLADNQVTVTREIYDEGTRATRSQTASRNLRIIVIVLAALSLFYAIYLFSNGTSIFFTLLQLLLFWILFLWVGVFMPQIRHKKGYKAMCRRDGGTPTRRVRFYEEYLQVTIGNGESTEFPYSKILSIQETEHLFLLNTDGKSLTLSKDGFFIGNIDIVRSLIENAPDEESLPEAADSED